MQGFYAALDQDKRNRTADSRQPERHIHAIQQQPGAEGRADGPADIEKGVVQRKDFGFHRRRQGLRKIAFQYRGEDRIGAVDQGEPGHGQRGVMGKRNSHKAADKDGDSQQHIAFFFEAVGEDAEAQTKEHPYGQGDTHGDTDLIHRHMVLAIQIDGHKRQRSAATNG